MANEVHNLNVSMCGLGLRARNWDGTNPCTHGFHTDTLLVTETGYELLTARANEPIMTWNEDLINR